MALAIGLMTNEAQARVFIGGGGPVVGLLRYAIRLITVITLPHRAGLFSLIVNPYGYYEPLLRWRAIGDRVTYTAQRQWLLPGILCTVIVDGQKQKRAIGIALSPPARMGAWHNY